ncbi:MAG: outer membrane beta-barrel protein [Idiomarina sp.]|nr:outer membrane beta-barrel protein [Idiomarina sp.]
MKRKLQLTLCAVVLGSASSSALANQIGVGYYDFNGTGIYVHGAIGLQPNLSLMGELGETNDTMFRVGLRYNTAAKLSNAPVHVIGGLSSYPGDNGVYVGAGISSGLATDLRGTAEIIHDTAGPGFFRMNLGLEYAIDRQLSLQGGYSVNTDRVSDEFRLGVSYRF